MYKFVFAPLEIESIEDIYIFITILQDLKVPKGSGSRRGSFNPQDGEGGGDDEPVVSRNKTNSCQKYVITNIDYLVDIILF